VFRVTVFHADALATNTQAVLNALKEASDNYAANFELTVSRLGAPTNFPLPWVVVGYPAGSGIGAAAWQGPFTPDAGRLLLDSPARRELVRRLAGGDSVVWVLLDGDRASAALLDAELPRLAAETVLPEVDPDDPRTEGNTELKVAFSVLPVSHRNPAEAAFVSMLVNVDPDLAKETGPVAFPFFGRGRMLTGFYGKALNPANIAETSQYLCGACSCEIKEQNPGVDMLLAADWESAVAERVVKDPPLPPLVSLAALAEAAQPPEPVLPAAVDGRLRRSLLLTLGGLVCVVVLAGAAMMVRRRP
jgi:hypothetical protein